MLVHKPSKKLLLNLKDPARVLDVIPGSKSLQVEGKTRNCKLMVQSAPTGEQALVQIDSPGG